MKLAVVCFAGVFLVLCAVWDLIRGEIPALVLYMGVAAVLVLESVSRQSLVYLFAASCAYCIAAALSKYVDKWIGEADIDVIFIALPALGITAWVWFLLASSVLGCVVLTPLVILKKLDVNERVPLIPILAAGYAAAVILGGGGTYW